MEARFRIELPHWIRLTLGVILVAASLSGCSGSAQNDLDRGNAQLEKGNVDAAVLEYRNAVNKDPMFAPARLELAEASIRQGNGAGAFGEAVRAADLLPNDAQLKAGSLLFVQPAPLSPPAHCGRALRVVASEQVCDA